MFQLNLCILLNLIYDFKRGGETPARSRGIFDQLKNRDISSHLLYLLTS